MRPGEPVTIGDGPGVYGYPLVSLSDLPAGTYDVQSFLNVYTTFHRSDGSVVQLHMPCGDGGFFPDFAGQPVRRRPARRARSRDRRGGPAAHAPHPAVGPGPARRHVPAGEPGRQRAREARQDQERPAVGVLGPADVHRRRRAPSRGVPPARLGAVPGHLRPDALPVRQPARIPREPRQRLLQVVGLVRRAPHDRGDHPAREPVLRRLVRRELGQPRSVRRRDHRGSSCRTSTRTSARSRTVGPGP